ncbi:MAG: hypothetical protein NT122_08255, partial [Solirubrobacterales bacterium]|nr:hypothetical protein [Solirubrobacterales bacterium]
GSARRLSDASWLVAWGGLPLIVAYGKDHARRFVLRFEGNTYSYRAAPISSSQMSRAALVTGMDSMHPRR